MIPSPRDPSHDRDVEWRAIEQFPGYSVSSSGFVRNDRTGYTLVRLVNQSGVLYVGLTVGREQFNRSVPRLVADAFLLPHPFKTFDTPIQLNGERTDTSARNLMWRPLWFARKYIQQFRSEIRGSTRPIIEEATGEYFETSWLAAIKFGLLDREILMAILSKGEVWPTGQRFVLLGGTHIVTQRKHGL